MVALLSLIAELGHDVVVDGKIANVIAQHMVAQVSGKNAVYFEVPGNPQTVAYVPKGFDCPYAAVLEARVIEVKGGGKRQKSEEVFTEAHLDVSKWTCLPVTVDELLDAKDDARILALGRAALPGLVRATDDSRVWKRERRLLNEGELTNRPPTGKAPAEKWAEVEVTVGEHAKELIWQLVAPPPGRGKPKSSGPPVISDYAKWWRERWHKTLEELRAEPVP